MTADTRLFTTLAEWEASRASAHRRDGHPTPVRGCPWCERMAWIEDVFMGRVAPEPSDGLTLWSQA